MYVAEYSKALQTGELLRPDQCESCGKSCKVQGHHTDYKKPLKVIWLCSSCHSKTKLKNVINRNWYLRQRIGKIIKRRKVEEKIIEPIIVQKKLISNNQDEIFKSSNRFTPGWKQKNITNWERIEAKFKEAYDRFVRLYGPHTEQEFLRWSVQHSCNLVMRRKK